MDDPSSRVREFAGDHRHVADYLTAEVLDALMADLRSFLLRTSVLGRFTASTLRRRARTHRLGVRCWPRSSARTSSSSRSTAAGDWFRYHTLFAELLQLELEALDPRSASGAPPPRERLVPRARAVRRGHRARRRAGARLRVRRPSAAEDHPSMLQRTGSPRRCCAGCARSRGASCCDLPDPDAGAAVAVGLDGRPDAERHRFVALAERKAASIRPVLAVLRRRCGDDARVLDRRRRRRGGRRTAGDGRREPRRAPRSTLPAMAGLAYALSHGGRAGAARASRQKRAIRHPRGRAAAASGFVEALAVPGLVEADEGHADVAETRAREALEFGCAAGDRRERSAASPGSASRARLPWRGAARGRSLRAERGRARGAARREPTEENVHGGRSSCWRTSASAAAGCRRRERISRRRRARSRRSPTWAPCPRSPGASRLR